MRDDIYCKWCNRKIEHYNGGRALGIFWVHSNTRQAGCEYKVGYRAAPELFPLPVRHEIAVQDEKNISDR